jgi:hypothetical protein
VNESKVEVDVARSDHLDAFRLDGRVALITGAGSERGIGREIGLAYAAAPRWASQMWTKTAYGLLLRRCGPPEERQCLSGWMSPILRRFQLRLLRWSRNWGR